MKYIVTLVVGICMSLSLLAQNTFDVMTLTGRFGFPQSYTDIYDGKATEYGTMVSLAAPIQLTEKTMWFNSVNYFYWNVSNEETMPNLVSNPINIHGFLLRTGMVQKL